MSARSPLIFDCHSDVPVDVLRRRRAGESCVLERLHLPRFREGGVGGSMMTVGGDAEVLCPYGIDHAFESTFAMVSQLKDDATESASVTIATEAAEVREQLEAGVLTLILALEGAGPIGTDLTRLEVLRESGVRVCGLTWNSQNALATGLGQSQDDGLSALGRSAIAEMNRLGIVVDVAHAAERTFWDVVHATEAPIIASHANARDVHDHPRNLDREQLAAIRDMKGMVGVVPYPEFVGHGTLVIEDVVRHVEFLAEEIGVDCVGIGSDFIDFALDAFASELSRSDVYAASQLDDLKYPSGLEDVRSLGNLLDILRARGWGERDIEKVARENVLRMVEMVET